MRDFNDAGGLQYTTAQVNINIDIEDFDDGAGVQGVIYDRRVYDLDGEDVTGVVADSINEGMATLPPATFVVGPGVLAESSDLVGDITSQYVNAAGETVGFETGNYYAIVSGDGADEIVGVYVL